MSVWFEWYPDRVKRELEALEEKGIPFNINEEAKTQGRLVLSLSFEHKGVSYDLTAEYPDLYPFFAPDVYAPSEDLVRHQHPESKHLCLLGRRTSAWHTDYLLADILDEQLRVILDYNLNPDPEIIKDLEEPQGEPIGEYFNGVATPNGYILFDSEWKVPAKCDRGHLIVKYALTESNNVVVGVPQGFVDQVLDEHGNVITEWTGPAPKNFSKSVKMPWVRIDPPPKGSLEDLKARIGELDRKYLTIDQAMSKKNPIGFFALLYREEVEQFKFSDGWTIVQRFYDRKRAPNKQNQGRFIRTFRSGEADLNARMPAVRTLRSKSVAVFGLGALGSFVTLELARAGVGTIRALDFDYVEPATIRRWARGWSAFGRRKVGAMADLIRQEYPWTEVKCETWKVGSTGREDPDVSQWEQLTRVISECDLVVDATAELGVNHILAVLCQQHGKPFVLANGTPGAWGGMVAQFDPTKKHACWMCMRAALYVDGQISAPAADPNGELQPPGCAARTFTGTSFDLQEVALEAVRVACGIFQGSDYPNTAWQLGLVRLRDDSGNRVPIQWDGIDIKARESCDCRSH